MFIHIFYHWKSGGKNKKISKKNCKNFFKIQKKGMGYIRIKQILRKVNIILIIFKYYCMFTLWQYQMPVITL